MVGLKVIQKNAVFTFVPLSVSTAHTHTQTHYKLVMWFPPSIYDPVCLCGHSFVLTLVWVQ